MSFLVTNWPQIPWKLHDYSMSFIQVLLVFHAQTRNGFWTSSSHRISRTFSKKMMGFPSDFVSFLTKLPSEKHEETRVTFFTGLPIIIYYNIYTSNRRHFSCFFTNRRQFGWFRNWHQIPWQFHVIYTGFICFACSNMTWILEKFKSWNFHGIC